jgi:hypothetical protein
VCFGKSKSQPVPAPTPPTTFQPLIADGSRDAQTKAAILSSSTQPASAGSDLSGGGATTLGTGTSPVASPTTSY